MALVKELRTMIPSLHLAQAYVDALERYTSQRSAFRPDGRRGSRLRRR
jgi:hypothetical protein